MTQDYLNLFNKRYLQQILNCEDATFLLKYAVFTVVITNAAGLIDSIYLANFDNEYLNLYYLKQFGIAGLFIEDTATSVLIYSVFSLFIWATLKITKKNESVRYRYVLCIVLIYSIFEILLVAISISYVAVVGYSAVYPFVICGFFLLYLGAIFVTIFRIFT